MEAFENTFPAQASENTASEAAVLTENNTGAPEDITEPFAEEVPAEELPAEEAPAGEVSAEEAPAEEAPAGGASAEEALAEEAPADEVPAAEGPARETPGTPVPAQQPAMAYAVPVQPHRGTQQTYGQVQKPMTFGQTTPGAYTQRQGAAYARPQRPAVPAAAKKTRKKRKGISPLGIIAIALACALVGGLLGGLIARTTIRNSNPAADPALLDRIEALEAAAEKVPQQQAYDALPTVPATDVYEQNVGSVVGVTTGATTTNVFGQTSGIASSGSGFIIREDGYVVTNYHVIQGGQTLSVTLRDGMEYPAEIVGYDSSMDVAVLKIDAPDLRAVTVGDSDLLRVGDQVAAIGNPLGELTLSMTVGYISALDREINTDGIPINMLQTDVAINSGNSGGPLFDMKGNVIGITTAKYSGATSSGAAIEGIGFALPINDVMKIVDDLLELGYITGRAYLGITAMDMDAQTAAIYSLPVGAYVNSVVEGFCAEKAGVRTGDIILGLGEYEISCYADLSRALREFSPGDETKIEIFRAGARMTLRVTFDERPSDEELDQQTAEPPEEPAEGTEPATPEMPEMPEVPAEPEQAPESGQEQGGFYDFGPFGSDDMEEMFRFFFGG